MANSKISITAEFVSIMRSKNNPKNLYFISPKGFRLYNLTKAIISEKKIREIFSWRLKLSEVFDKKIFEERPRQIIDLTAGYSLRGLNLCLADQDLVYIDADLPEVISRKSEILRKMCEKEKIIHPRNYFLIPVNVLESDIWGKVKNVVSTDKKTLITAEGLTSYFSDEEFKLFIKNIESLLSNFSNAEFYSHENIHQPKGIIYKILRSIFVSFLTRTKGRQSFPNEKEFGKFLENLRVKFKFDPAQKEFLFYSLFKN